MKLSTQLLIIVMFMAYLNVNEMEINEKMTNEENKKDN